MDDLFPQLQRQINIPGYQPGFSSITRPGAMTVSGFPSRHRPDAQGFSHAADITHLNGIPVTSPEGKKLADAYVASLEAQGFSRNHESGNPRAVLWQTNTGGNHFNHIHVSYRPDLERPEISLMPSRAAKPNNKLGALMVPSGVQDAPFWMPPDIGAQPQGNPQSDPLLDNYLSTIKSLQGYQNDQFNAPIQPEYNPQIAMAQAQNQSQIAGLNAAPQLEPQPTMDLPQYNPPPRPGMQMPDIPQRPNTSVPPAAALLAGIGSIITPGGAGNFGASAIQGAKDQAAQVYQDRITQYNQHLQQAMAQHEDDLAARNEMINFARTNLDRKAQADYSKAVAQWQLGRQQGDIAQQHASLNSMSASLDSILKKTDDQSLIHQQAAKELQRIQDYKDQAMSQATVLAAQTKGENEILKTMVQGGYGLQRVQQQGANQFANQGLRNQGNLDVANAKGGYQISVAHIAAKSRVDAAAKRIGTSGDPSVRAQMGAFLAQRKQIEQKVGIEAKALAPNSFATEAQKETARQNLQALDQQYTDLGTRMQGYADNLKPNTQGGPAANPTRKQFTQNGQTFWAHVENGKWVKE